ncbi:2OG-Fe(II) oxygenase [Silvanigrella aquatica]|uniref:Prolyl 4-hydroxylase alpha subunit Fe(2+) 2OG dioxygenase domain-containing protein n=1 Tax=Silvanigrella aquatica TaxID=1915309 RepID=A0A1L4CZ72_9BACT|nr:2OG-Fe(II) oxygenase [Silvanigrella aquatica]APJ03248.1 hypothetical protein AXG55_04745 [Silvanigrella aquatica]
MSLYKRIHIANKLFSKDINSLIKDEILALIVEKFYAHESCIQLSSNILKSKESEKYMHENIENKEIVNYYFGVDRLGVPFNLTYNQSFESEIVHKYYDQILPSRERLRKFAKPAVTSIDKLRLELDEQYEYGANVAHFQGKKMLTGIARIAKAKLSYMSAEQPHFDALPEKYFNLDKQFAANIYLKVPHVGGELEIWDVAPLPPLFNAPKKWREQLPTSIKITPKTGDLIIFNCRRPHAIGAFEGEDRISEQTFIGYKSKQSLKLWN